MFSFPYMHLHCSRCGGDNSYPYIKDGLECQHCWHPMDEPIAKYRSAAEHPAHPTEAKVS